MDKIILDKVSNGLRRMKSLPDFFIFLTQKDWTCDRETIFGIPVYHCSSQVVKFKVLADMECPFIPCNYKEKINDYTVDFAMGYYEEGNKTCDLPPKCF